MNDKQKVLVMDTDGEDGHHIRNLIEMYASIAHETTTPQKSTRHPYASLGFTRDTGESRFRPPKRRRGKKRRK